MKYFSKGLAIIVSASFVICPAAMAAKAKSPKKPAAKVVPHIVQGTTQLSGENAQFGVTYTLGKSAPFNLTLNKAEYVVDPITVGDNTYTTTPDTKLLVLHFTYHNPRKEEAFTRWDTFPMTIVDPKDQNNDGPKDLAMEKDGSPCAMSFKPAQKVDVWALMEVPAASEMPKLIVKCSDDTVLRYDLRGKVKGLPETYADPADKTGATALEKINAKIGEDYYIDVYKFNLTSVAYAAEKQLGEADAGEEGKLVVAKFTMTNSAPRERFFRWDTLETKLIDIDGVEVCNAYDVYQNSKDKGFDANLAPGQEIKLRYIFKVPNDTDLKTFSIKSQYGRTYLYDISSVKP